MLEMVQLSLKLDYKQAIVRRSKRALIDKYAQLPLMAPKPYKDYLKDAQAYYPRLYARHAPSPSCKPPTNNGLERMMTNAKR